MTAGSPKNRADFYSHLSCIIPWGINHLNKSNTNNLEKLTTANENVEYCKGYLL